MPKVALYNVNGDQVGEVELKDEVFGIEPNEHAVFDAVLLQQAAERLGTHSTKSRGEVAGGGRKPWRQKGTGRARHGTTRSPIWRGGAITFGPKPRKYGFTMPKKVRRLALKSALSSKVQAGEIIVLDQLAMSEPKTKEMLKILSNLKVEKKALVVTSDLDVNVVKSARNIPGVKPVQANTLNVYDLLRHDQLVITKDAVSRVEEVLA